MKIHLIQCWVAISLLLKVGYSKAQVALAFNGTSNYVSTNGSPVLNNLPRTVDAWIKTTSTITTQMVICDWGALSPNASRFTLNLINSKLRIEIGGIGFAGNTNLNTGQWFHVSAVYSPSITSGPNAFLYVNGNLEASGNFTGYPTLATATTTGFRIGVRVDGINFFNGAVDEVKVYNYPRTQAQIAADTLEYCTPPVGLVAYYKLNEGIANGINTTSTTALDYSGNGNNGTLNSFALSGTVSNWVPGRVNSGAPSLSVSPGTNICAGTNLTLTTNAANNFTWSTGNSTSSLIVVTPTLSETFSVATSNSLINCASSSVAITVNSVVPTLTITTAQNPICLGASTSFSATGATSYSWSGGITNGQSFTPAATTAYTLTAANACGTVNSVQTVSVVPMPVTVGASQNTVCESYSCNLSATSAATNYTWFPGGQTGASVFVYPLSTTIYTVSASNASCAGTQTIQINTQTTPSITTSNTFVMICEGESVALGATGAGTNGSYTWSPGLVSAPSITVNPGATTTYSVMGTNSLGCTALAQIPVLVQLNPSLTVTASGTLLCSGESATLNASGAGTYTWSSGGNASVTSVTPLGALSVYSVSGTSSGNTCVATQTIALAVFTPSVNYTTSLSVCSGASATLSASGALSYTWNNIPSPSGQQIVTPLSNSIYTLVAITQSINTFCPITQTATVMVNPNPTVIASANKTLECTFTTVSLTATGAGSYTWSNNYIGASNTVAASSFNVITYTVTGADVNGCTGSSSVLVRYIICSGIFENDWLLETHVYPNPASGKVIIRSDRGLVLHVYTAQGELVKVIRSDIGETQVDMSELAKGMYFIRPENSSTNFSRKLMIE